MLKITTGLYCKQEPFIGLEPMTYALPWRYSTPELKGLLTISLPMEKSITYSIDAKYWGQ
jgi:hypothetical protein